jgi:four helix bundle protein
MHNDRGMSEDTVAEEKVPPGRAGRAPRDIQERAFQFAVKVICFTNGLPPSVAARIICQQLVRAGTSVGANLEEVDSAETKKDFVHKVGIALKEAKETLYWLRLAEAALVPGSKDLDGMLEEARQLVRILVAIKRKASQSSSRGDSV